MTKIAKYAFLLGPLVLGGCDELFVPNAPPAPPMPTGPAAPATPPISVADLPALQAMNERAAFIQSATSLVSSHSERDLIKQFSTQLNDAYKQHQAAIAQVIKPTGLVFPAGLTSKDQQRLTRLTRLYGRAFDRSFLREVAVSFSMNDRQKIIQVQQTGSTDVLKKLAGAALQIEREQKQKAQDLSKH